MARKIKIAVHQPNFIPWPGYFAKIKAADIFVLFDTAQYTKNSYINRNKILINNEVKWITIPVRYKNNSSKPIREIEISIQDNDCASIMKTLKQHYGNYPFFDSIYPDFRDFLLRTNLDESLFQLNKNLIIWICQLLSIKTKIVDASQLKIQANGATETLIAMCKACKGEIYLSGSSGKKYLKEELFEEAGMQLEYLSLDRDIEKWEGLSILHWLFIYGPKMKLKI